MKAMTSHWRNRPSHLAGHILAAVIVTGCATGPTPDKRVLPRDPDPRCPASLAPQVPEFTVSRAEIDKLATLAKLPVSPGHGVGALYSPVFAVVFIADDIQGWRLRHVRQWERCRAWLHRETGSPLMAWERAPASGGAS